MDSKGTSTEAGQIREILGLPVDGSTELVIGAIRSLLVAEASISRAWGALTDMLYLPPDTDHRDVLGNVASYLQEAEYLRRQERQHHSVIQKLQQDRAALLRRFHANKDKSFATADRIRTKGRYIGNLERHDDAIESDLGIIDDDGDSMEDAKIEPNSETIPPKTLWQILDEALPPDKKLSNGDVNKSNPKNRLKSANGSRVATRQKEPDQEPRGLIIPVRGEKGSTGTEGLRTNVTPGTRESDQQTKSRVKGTSRKSGAISSRNKNIVKPGSSVSKNGEKSASSKGKESKRSSNKDVIIMSTSVEVTQDGGCFDIPDLGIRMSVPHGLLSEKTQTLTLSLEWRDASQHSGLRNPVCPIIDVKPSGIPFNKPLVISLPHNVTISNANLKLMKGEGSNKWKAVEDDTKEKEQHFVPLGFIAENTAVIHINTSGRYALTQSDSKRKVIPRSLRVSGFVQYIKDSQSPHMMMEIYAAEENAMARKFFDIISSTCENASLPKFHAFEACINLPGSPSIEASLQEVMEGWSVDSQNKQSFDVTSTSSPLTPVAVFKLTHTLPQLRCLLGQVTFKQKGHDPTHINLCVDLDQFSEGSSVASSKASTATSRAATFMTDYYEDADGNTHPIIPSSERNQDENQTKVYVKSLSDTRCWLPDRIKSSLAEEIRQDMTDIDKWFALVSALGLGGYRNILTLSHDPVLDMLAYCEISKVSIIKVKDILQEMRFEEAARVITEYLKNSLVER